MIIVDLPPAEDSCGDLAANELHVMCSSVITSPDRRWLIVIKGEGKAAPIVHLKRRPVDDTAIVAEARTGRTVATFELARDATVHWLKDERHVIVNYFEGSDVTRPLVVVLPYQKKQTPTDLQALIRKDVAQRVRRRTDQLDHFYTEFVSDDGDRVTISSEFRFPAGPWKDGNRPQHTKCYVYSVDKATFRHYRFVSEPPLSDCPVNTDDHPG